MFLVATIAAAVTVSVGALVVAMGTFGVDALPKLSGREESLAAFNYPVAKQVAYPLVALILTVLLTGWFVAGLTAAGTAWVVPRVVARERDQQTRFKDTEALSTWIQQLRDALIAGGGLEQPLRYTAETGPERLRPYLRQLAADVSTGDTVTALKRFAASVENHIADMFVASYSASVRESTAGLPDLMTAISESAIKEVEAFRSIEVSRRKIKSSVRMIVGILLAFALGLTVFARDFLTAYDSPSGQMVLAFVGAIVLASYWWIGNLSVVRRPPRFFGLFVDERESAGALDRAAAAPDVMRPADDLPRQAPAPAPVPAAAPATWSPDADDRDGTGFGGFGEYVPVDAATADANPSWGENL